MRLLTETPTHHPKNPVNSEQFTSTCTVTTTPTWEMGVQSMVQSSAAAPDAFSIVQHGWRRGSQRSHVSNVAIMQRRRPHRLPLILLACGIS
eukprot:SAG25_NODE_374_length_8940_cov_97.908155_12_plen_92_part_00